MHCDYAPYRYQSVFIVLAPKADVVKAHQNSLGTEWHNRNQRSAGGSRAERLHGFT